MAARLILTALAAEAIMVWVVYHLDPSILTH